MNVFDECRQFEALAFNRLRPFIEIRSDGLVVTDKGTLAPFLQEVVGDIICNSGGRVWTIELKAERKASQNLFIEVWSNKNLDDIGSHAMRGSNPGWIYKTRADLLFYWFEESDILYIIDMFALKRWCFGYAEFMGKIYNYPEKMQRQHRQANDTHGRLIPIIRLAADLGKRMKEVTSSELSLLEARGLTADPGPLFGGAQRGSR